MKMKTNLLLNAKPQKKLWKVPGKKAASLGVLPPRNGYWREKLRAWLGQLPLEQ